MPKALMDSLDSINLADNPFDCTCALLWFRSMIHDNSKTFGAIRLVGWPYRYDCITPTSLTKTPLQNYKPTQASCQNILLSVVVGLGSFIVVASTVCVVVFKYRWYIRYWFYKLKSKRPDRENEPLLQGEQSRYDGYVIYNIKDRHFVHGDFREIMEDKRHFGLHIWERDGAVGGAKLEAMVESIYASRHAVAVISRYSLRDSWVQFQINVALDRQMELQRDFLLLVLLDDFDIRTLNKFWCVMMTRVNNATWCQDETDIKHTVFQQNWQTTLGDSGRILFSESCRVSENKYNKIRYLIYSCVKSVLKCGNL